MRKINSIALVSLTPDSDANENGGLDLPSYGIKRIQAAVIADPELAGCRVSMIDLRIPVLEAYVDAILAVDPSLIGISAYVWSTRFLVNVALEIKRRKPDTLIIFGGPSSRPEMFDLDGFPDPHTFLDGVVSTEGELIFNQIAKLPTGTADALAQVPGLHLPMLSGWRWTGKAPKVEDLDHIPSPYQLGIMPKNSVAYLETFRGCPMSCRFCEWGVSDKSSTVFSKEYLVRELQAYAEVDVSAIFSVDAGLNLNNRALQNLMAADQEVGLLRSRPMWAEIYPTNIRDQHLEFLSRIQIAYLGIGLQSIDPAVLRDQDRPFKMDKFEETVRKIADIVTPEVQIIMGLPGDTPEGFLRTLEFARSLPATVRAYHCLVLPDALLSRPKPNWNMHFDHYTLRMSSCLGWSEDDFARMREFNSREAQQAGGRAGDFWWFFPRQ